MNTENGRVYRDILILDSDRHGLLFRHEKGIAKFNYDQLSMNLRMLYEPVGEIAEESTVPEAEESPPGGLAFPDKDLSFTLTVRSRIVSPWLPWQGDPGFCRSRCSECRRAWPQHGSRYHRALRLAIPECRAFAVDDFLITTGLVPRPPGVMTYRLPYNRP